MNILEEIGKVQAYYDGIEKQLADLKAQMDASVEFRNVLQSKFDALTVEKQKLETSLASLSAEKKLVDDSLTAALSDRQSLQNLLEKPKQRKGFNTHMFSPTYDIDKVIKCLQAVNCKFIRQDFDYDPATGKMLNHDKWTNEFKPRLDAAGIHVRAMFYIRGTDGFDAYNKLCVNYPYFDEIEIGNENAVRSLLAGKSGDMPTDYNGPKLLADCAYIKAAYMALLQYPVKPIISITWIHYYYIDYLRSLGVNAILSVHSYTDGFNNVASQAKYKGLDALQAPTKKYGGMVTEIGETNYFPSNTVPYTDQLQVDKGVPLIRKILSYGVDLYMYELIDRPERTGREGHFGFFNADGSAKPIVAALSDIW